MTTAYVGTTRVIRVNDLRIIPGDPDDAQSAVTSLGVGDSIVFTIVDADSSLILSTVSATNGGSGDDWYATVTMPSTPGRYQLRATATINGSVEVWTEDLYVRAIPSAGAHHLATRGEIRRGVQDMLGDLIRLTATSDGSVGTFSDALNLFDSNHAYTGSHIVFTDIGPNYGLVRRVTGSTQSLGTVGFAPTLPAITLAGERADLHNLYGSGWTVDELNRRIDAEIDRAFPSILTQCVSKTTIFNSEETTTIQAISVDEEPMTHVYGVFFGENTSTDSELGPRMWKPRRGGVQIIGGGVSLLDGKNVYLEGYRRLSKPVTDDDPVEIPADYLVTKIAGQLASMRPDRQMQAWSVEWKRTAEASFQAARTPIVANTEPVWRA